MARRRTLRRQLTFLYAGPFLVSGAALLTLPILQTRESSPVHPGLTGNPVRAAGPNADLVRVITASAAGLAVMVLVSVVLGWLIAGRFLRPLRTIIDTSRDISASNLHRRLGLTGRTDEFAELAKTLDDLFGRLEAAFAAQRRFVANASHELRTPLTAERTLLQVALADPDATTGSLRAACHDVLALGAAQERLIDSLLTLASGEQGVEQAERFDLAELAGAVLLSRAPRAAQRDIRVTTALAPAPATGDPALVESLIANLVDNALRHNTDGGRFEIATTTTADRSTITVSNTGPVVPPDQLDRLFQPFQRLGPQRIRHSDGHGLGLAIVRAIAGAHDATLTAVPRPAGGLDVTVSFPR
jgi:signal transduction histidine kinase